MSDAPFWLSDEQFSRLEPHLPQDTRGKARVDDRRVISGSDMETAPFFILMGVMGYNGVL